MSELVLQAGDDHVGRLAHESEPLRAVVELIWNAIDAEADNIVVEIRRDELTDTITEVVVRDDGHGISPDAVPNTFGRIGDSWKKFATKSKNKKRRLHGQLGEGRLRIFALGNEVSWDSHSKDTAGQTQRVRITGSTTRRGEDGGDAGGGRQDEAPHCGEFGPADQANLRDDFTPQDHMQSSATPS